MKTIVKTLNNILKITESKLKDKKISIEDSLKILSIINLYLDSLDRC